MKIEWKFQGFVSDRVTDKIVGSVYRLLGSVPELTHVVPIYDHPEDVSTHNGQTYVRKPPVWEEKLDEWLKQQQELADTFDDFYEYAKTARTMLSITK